MLALAHTRAEHVSDLFCDQLDVGTVSMRRCTSCRHTWVGKW